MALIIKPHAINVYAPIEGSDTGAGVEATEWEGSSVVVNGMVQPLTADAMYQDYALVCQRPLRLFANVEHQVDFPYGAVFSWVAANGTKWGRVIAPVIVHDAEPITSHIVVLAEVWSPAGTSLE